MGTDVTSPDWLVLPDDVDLTTCDREAIHLPGAIQPHGALLVVDPNDQRIRAASANAGAMLGGRDDVPLGRALGELAAPELHERLADRVATADHRTSLVRGPARSGSSGTWMCHRSNDAVVMEFEPSALSSEDVELLLRRVAEASGDVAAAADLADAQQMTADQVRRLLGVDRAMVYRFHPDGHGEVVAESLARGEPYLGLHYPATDIPRQARALYVRSWTRLIADVDAPDVPLLGEAGRAYDVDLAGAQLRAVSPIHVQYLRNMGVRASMSLSLVVGGQLVGLVACHHSEPLALPYGVRLCAELLARNLSEQLSRAEARHDAEARDRRREAQMVLLGAIADEPGVSALEQAAGEQRILLGADAFVVDDGTHVVADTAADVDAPEPSLLLDVARDMLDGGRLVRADAVAELLPDAPFTGGVLAARSAADTVLAWWRAPRTTTVVWAGNPDKPMQDDDGRLTPRASFEAWRQTVEGHGVPWDDDDADVAGTVAEAVGAAIGGAHGAGYEDLDHVIGAIVQMNSELRAAHRRQARAIDDLEDMLSLVAHDVRGMLATVGGHAEVVATLLRDHHDPKNRVQRSLGAIDRGVANIGRIIEDAHRWARTGRELQASGPVDLTVAADTAAATLSDRVEEHGATIRIEPLPTVLGDAGLLREVFQNLFENCLKYRGAEPPQVHVASVSPHPVGEVVVTVTDNGVGIAPEDQDRVQRAFVQLDRTSSGSGLGLALVRKIVEAMGGSMRIEGAPGQGTTVALHLPDASARVPS